MMTTNQDENIEVKIEENIEEIFNEILSFSEDEAYKYAVSGYESTKNPEYLLYIAQAHLVFGEYEETIGLVEKSLEEGCNHMVYAYNLKGEALVELGLYVEARRTFERVIEIEEDNFTANVFLVELDIREEFYQTAIDRCLEYLDKYEVRDSQIGEIKSIIGWTYMVDLEDLDKAEIAFKEAVEKNPTFARAHTGSAILMVAESKFTEAIETFNKAIELDESDAENHLGLAICYKELNKYEKVEEHLIKADLLEPGDSRVLIELAFEAIRQEKEEVAIEYLKELLSINPDEIEVEELLQSLK